MATLFGQWRRIERSEPRTWYRLSVADLLCLLHVEVACSLGLFELGLPEDSALRVVHVACVQCLMVGWQSQRGVSWRSRSGLNPNPFAPVGRWTSLVGNPPPQA